MMMMIYDRSTLRATTRSYNQSTTVKLLRSTVNGSLLTTTTLSRPHQTTKAHCTTHINHTIILIHITILIHRYNLYTPAGCLISMYINTTGSPLPASAHLHMHFLHPMYMIDIIFNYLSSAPSRSRRPPIRFNIHIHC